MKQSIITTLLSLLICLVSAKATEVNKSYDFEKDGIYYKVEYSSKKTIYGPSHYISGVGVTYGDIPYSGHITIPEFVYINQENAKDFEFNISINPSTQIRVTSIKKKAFYNCKGLEGIDLPHLDWIGDSAFANCEGLKAIVFPSSLHCIYDHAFQDCKNLESINYLEEDIAGESRAMTRAVSFDDYEIGDYAFDGCIKLKHIDISRLVYNGKFSIGKGAFRNCAALKTIKIPGFSHPYNGTNIMYLIGSKAFEGCNGLKDVYTELQCNILEDVFDENTYQNATLHVPEGKIDSYKDKFGWRKFFNIVEGNDEIENDAIIVFADEKVKALCVANWDVNGDGELSKNEAAAVTDITNVFQKQTITSFDELSNFTGLTSIGEYAFEECSNLTSITIPNSVTSIGYAAFYGCFRLTSIKIPNNVYTIGGFAFFSTAISTIFISDNVTSIGDDAFSCCDNLKEIQVDPNNKFYTSVEGVLYNKDCSKIIRYPDAKAGSIYSILDGVKIIGLYAFGGNNNLVNIVLPESITDIEREAFYACGSMESITISASVNNIGDMAFVNCSALTSITIGRGVTIMGESSFTNCPKLTEVTSLAETVPVTKSKVFYGSNIENATLYVPKASIESYKSTAPWSNFKSVVAVEDKADEDILNGWHHNTDGYYEIRNVDDMLRLSAYVREGNSCEELAFKVVVDELDFGDVSMSPIGYYKSSSNYTPFKGRFDGQSVVIKNLSMSDQMSYRFGLFGYISGAEISNITMAESCSILGFDGVGSIVGYNEGGIVCGCVNYGSVSSSNRNIGGIVGYNEAFTATGEFVGGIVKDCDNYADINPGYYNAGGIVGHNVTGSVIHCTNTGSISSSENSYIGGIVGLQERGTVSDCYVTNCTLNGKNYVGVVFGKMDYVKVSNGYTSAGIECDNYYDSNVTVISGGTGETYNGTMPRGVGDQWKIPYDVPEIIYNHNSYYNGAMLSSELQGDANNDNVISTEDISTVEAYIMKENSKGFNFINTDMNGDQKVDVADIVSILNHIKVQQEVMFDDCYLIGKKDFSSGWWPAFSKSYQIPEGEKWVAQFNLHINPTTTKNYNNFALIITNDADRGSNGYREYGAIRFDHTPSGYSEWGDYINRELVQSTLSFDSDIDAGVQKLGGVVTLIVDRSNGGLKLTIDNGNVIKSYIDSGILVNLNNDPANTKIRCFIVPEGSYIDFLKSNIEPMEHN